MNLKNSEERNNKPINVLIVDDHEAIGAGLEKLGEFFEKLNFIGVCKSKDELEDFLKRQVPEVIIMDVSIGKTNGIALTKEILKRFPGIKVIVYSIYCHAGIVRSAIRSGASGFFTKSSDSVLLFQAIENLEDKKFVTSPDISEIIHENYLKTVKEEEPIFDEIDIAIIKKICEGKSLKQIGAELNLSEKTISNHKTNILKMLDLKNDADLIKYAIKNEIILLG